MILPRWKQNSRFLLTISQNSREKPQNLEETQILKQKTQGFGKSTWSTCRKSVEKKPGLMICLNSTDLRIPSW